VLKLLAIVTGGPWADAKHGDFGSNLLVPVDQNTEIREGLADRGEQALDFRPLRRVRREALEEG
jgi:hypothetical protein